MDRSFERQVSLRTAAQSGKGSWANYPLCSDAVPILQWCFTLCWLVYYAGTSRWW